VIDFPKDEPKSEFAFISMEKDQGGYLGGWATINLLKNITKVLKATMALFIQLTTQKYIRKKKPITNINLYFPHREFKD
jgi:hypothetical protein